MKDTYVDMLKKWCKKHNMDKKFDQFHQWIDKYKKHKPCDILIEEIQVGANKWDGKHVLRQRGSGKDCRKKKDGKFPYFPEMNVWWHRRRVYKWLVKFHNGKNVNLRAYAKHVKQTISPNQVTQLLKVQEWVLKYGRSIWMNCILWPMQNIENT